MKFISKSLLFLLIVSLSCTDNSVLVSDLENINDNIKNKYAPDKRVAIFNVLIDYKKDSFAISGETNIPEAHQKLIDSLQSLGILFKDKVRILPDTAVGKNKFAVARNSVINIRSAPKHSAELGTQGLLGMSLKVLDKKGDFYRIQTPDNYISWVDKGGIQLMNTNQFEDWSASEKIIFTKGFGYVYADEKFTQIISDISLGGILKIKTETNKYYQVVFPDNRTGFVKKQEAKLYSNWLTNSKPSSENIEIVAKQMLGFPYLWGGTSAKGMDCSGFTKMVYLMNGFIIPRDASQQINAGKIVDKNLDFSDLKKGDLLFFGKKATKTNKQRVTHVGIWLGNNKMEFIHASGNVHISSMDSLQINYDAFNKNRYLGSRRYLNSLDKAIFKLE